MSARGSVACGLVVILCLAVGMQLCNDSNSGNATALIVAEVVGGFNLTVPPTPVVPPPTTADAAVKVKSRPSSESYPPTPPDAVDVDDVTVERWSLMKRDPGSMPKCTELASCRFKCNHTETNTINPCFGGCLCPTPDCIVMPGQAPSTFRCVSNPFYARTPLTGRPGLSCRSERPGETPPAVPNRSVGMTDADWELQRDLALFKQHTNVWLDHWADWKAGPCVAKPFNGGKMSFAYDEESHFYTIRNLCFRATGPQFAFSGKQFGDRIFSDWNNDVKGGRDRRGYFNGLRQMREPARCYRNQSVLMDYVITPTYNTFFTALKSAAMRRFIDVHFSGANDVLLMRVLSQLTQNDEANARAASTHGYWRGALSQFGFAVIREREADLGTPVANDAMVCFDRVVMLHPCEMETCGGAMQQGDLPYLKWKVVVEGHRSPNEAASVSALRDAMARCTGVERPTPNVTHPRLVIVDRHRQKRYANTNMVMPHIADMAFKLGFYTLHVVDQRHGIEPVALARLHQRADVMIGHFGGGMTWLFLQPPGSVVAETAVGSCIDQFGPRWDPARGNPCDYAGLANNARISHYTSMLFKNRRIGDEDFVVSPDYWTRLLNLTLCRLRANAAVGFNRTFGAECDSPSTEEWEAMLPPVTPQEYFLSDP